MVTEKIQELERLQAKVAELKTQVETERTSELKGMPAKYGYDSLASFIKALKAAAGARLPRAVKAAKPAKGKRTRAVITEEMKAKVKELAEAGQTGAQIAAEVGISLPSVQNIKKSLGLVKARGAAEASSSEAAPASTGA